MRAMPEIIAETVIPPATLLLPEDAQDVRNDIAKAIRDCIERCAVIADEGEYSNGEIAEKLRSLKDTPCD